MALNVYTPEADRIIHHVRVDMTQRTMIQKPIHLVQYDDKLPIVAVSLYKDGQPYFVGPDYTASVRWGRHMESGCYNTVLGADSSYNIIYFEVTQAMAAISGASEFLIELLHDGKIGYSGPAASDVHVNPVSEGDIEIQPEYTAILEYVAMAEDAANRAEAAASGIEQYATDAKTYRDQAEQFKIASESARDDAKTYRDQTETLKNDAIKEVGDAKTSAITDITTLKTDTIKEVTDIKKDITDLKDETKGYRDNAQTSETNAKTSETNASDSATLAESWTKGGTGTRAGEDSNNAKYWSDQAKAAAQGDYIPNADRGVTIAELSDGTVPDSQLKKASTTNYGVIKPDGDTVFIDTNGNLASKGGVDFLTIVDGEVCVIYNI